MPGDGLTVLGPSDPRWDDTLRGTAHDLHHHRGYHALARWNGEGEPELAVYADAGARLVWPYLLREIPGTSLTDVGCVYGYAGPVLDVPPEWSPAQSSAFASAAWAAVSGAWRDRKVVSAFTTFDPLLGNADVATGWLGDPGPDPVLILGRTVSIDLDRTSDDRRASYEKETRYEIGRARRAGLRTWVDADGTHLPELARLYDQTMRRNGAAARYRFSPEYFERLWTAVEGRGRLLVAAIGDDVVGVLLYLVHGDLAHAHLTGVAEEHLRLAPLNTVLDAAADAARAEGARVLHLGGGRGGHEDSLYRFKRRIGDVERPFAVGRWVLDGAAYRQLSDVEGGAVEPAFFPAYRAPSSR